MHAQPGVSAGARGSAWAYIVSTRESTPAAYPAVQRAAWSGAQAAPKSSTSSGRQVLGTAGRSFCWTAWYMCWLMSRPAYLRRSSHEDGTKDGRRGADGFPFNVQISQDAMAQENTSTLTPVRNRRDSSARDELASRHLVHALLGAVRLLAADLGRHVSAGAGAAGQLVAVVVVILLNRDGQPEICVDNVASMA